MAEGSSRLPEDDSVEHLKNELYSRKPRRRQVGDIRTPLSPDRPEAPVAWSKPEHTEDELGASPQPQKPVHPTLAPLEEKKHMSLAAKFLIGSVLFFLVAVGAAAYMFFGGGNLISPSNIDIEVEAPSLIDSGKQATFQILINNRNASQLTLASLVVTYPTGTRDPSNPTSNLTTDRQSLGTISAGQQLTETSNALLFGSQGQQEQIQVALDYSVPGSNAVFQKQTSYPITIGSSPVSLTIDAPQTAISGQSFPINITVQSNATAALSGVAIQAQYPFGFSVVSTQPQAGAGGTFWNLGTLQPGQSEVLHVQGTLTGQNGDSRVLTFLAGTNSDPTDTTVKVPLLTVPQTITVQQPFITGTIAVNGQSGKTISATPGAPLSGTVTWQNNLTTALSNVQFTLSLSGPALDPSSITSSNGFYQSGSQSITWSSAQDSSLASVAPGASGTLNFSFSSLPPGANNLLITNPVINLNLAVSGQQADQSGTPQQVSSAASAQVSLASEVSLTQSALHFTGPLHNTGPMPPQAGKPTSYAIEWSVKNSANDIANATVKTVLPTYMQFVSAGQSGVSYDAGSRTVTWNIGNLAAGVGYSSAAKSTYFQVVLTPSATQIGSAPALVGDATFAGTDRFAQVGVGATANSVNTTLSETGFSPGMDIVAPAQ